MGPDEAVTPRTVGAAAPIPTRPSAPTQTSGKPSPSHVLAGQAGAEAGGGVAGNPGREPLGGPCVLPSGDTPEPDLSGPLEINAVDW